MNKRITRNLPTIRKLRRMPEKSRKSFVKNCSPDFINCICECSKNLLKGNVPVTPVQLKKLRRHKKALHTLSTKKASLKTRRQLLQRGGFLPLIIAPILGLVSSLVAGAINRKLDRQ